MYSKDKQIVALHSAFASAGLAVLKLSVGLLTGSLGLISEAAHSAFDLGAATLTYFAVRIGDKPADDRHPFGHGKVESVSALTETGLLFLTSAWIIYESIQRLFFKTVAVEVTWYAFVILLISIITDFSRSHALEKIAKKTRSQALEADALHFSSDILSSAVVLVGLVAVALGIPKADSIAAIGVAVFVALAGFRLGKRTVDVLVDTVPEGLTDEVIRLAKKVNGVVGIEKARVRPAGAFVFIDMVVSVSRKMQLEKAQEICTLIEQRIQKVIPEADVTVHTKPLTLDSETLIERVQIIAAKHNLPVHDIVAYTTGENRYLSFDLEVDANSTLKQAHGIASQLEKLIKEEVGNNISINIHIEPLRSGEVISKFISNREETKVREIVESLVRTEKSIRAVNNIQIGKTRNRLFITLNCLFDDDLSLEMVHNTASKLESLIREQLPNTERAVVHAEPDPGKEKA